MRACAILILIVGFVVAVILPNDIGTANLPATGCKYVKARLHHPAKGDGLAWLVFTPNQGDLKRKSDAQLFVYHSTQSAAEVQHSPPLLI